MAKEKSSSLHIFSIISYSEAAASTKQTSGSLMTKKPENNDPLSEKSPDRPLECSECKKSIAIRYTEIVGETTSQTFMCADCPELQKRLHGTQEWQATGEGIEGGAGLACGNCGTSLDAVRKGSVLGCCDCYDVFEDVIIQELVSSKKIPARAISNKRSTPLHVGRSPNESQEVNVSVRLLALNEALNEMLKKEDYEQAAWLRDQIKALTKEPEEKHDN